MLEKILVEYAAPTLAGLKSASMFVWKPEYVGEEKSEQDIYLINKKLNIRGIYVKILKRNDKKYLLLVYRKKMLEKILSEDITAKILRKRGYEIEQGTDIILNELSNRIKNFQCFPHEIGIFLGYPIDDVIAFIKNKGKNCKHVGHWKVYGNECTAIKLFEKFVRCKEVYIDCFKRGWTVEKLTVVA